MDQQDALKRSLANLAALRSALAAESAGSFREAYVMQFHEALESLESLGISVAEFRIPPSEVRPHVAFVDTLQGHTEYTNDRFVDRAMMLAKIDAVLKYFALSEEPKRTIGFRRPT